MFQPETEDMLPRMAPKPSSATDPIIRPQVPEVSILFGQQGNNLGTHCQTQSGSQQAQQTTSYAAWKKQILPKVTFPATAAQEIPQAREPLNNNNNNYMEELNAPRSNLYPLRTTAAAISMGNGNSNGFMGSGAGGPFVTSANINCNAYVTNGVVGVANPSCYRRSLDSYQPTQQQQPAYRKSSDLLPAPTQACSSPRDVLTICAGTQTEAISSPNGLQNLPLNLASKQDIEDLKRVVEEIRHDQLRLMQMFEAFVYSRHFSKEGTQSTDAAVQVDMNEKESSPITNGLNQAPIANPTNKFLQHLKPSPNVLQTPKGKPMAQSTTYRPNSPQSNRLQEYQSAAPPSPSIPTTTPLPTTNYQHWNNQVAVVLPKPSTDKSLVMNELALKYLPNEKLVELLKDLNMACPSTQPQKQIMESPTNFPTTPLRNMDNFERGPSDISNASYKYLKKYRLLPEDHIEDGENDNPIAYNTTPQQQYTARYSPGQRQTPPAVFGPQNPNSPMGRLPQSPLARTDVTPTQRNHMLDLENIKHQPKFL